MNGARLQRLGVAIAALGLVVNGRTEVRLPRVFGDHMVVQQGVPLDVWGWAAAAERVRVSLSERAAVEVVADAAGRWRAQLPPQPAGGPYVLVAAGATTARCEDVWIGEVWLCSGQSNMEWPVSASENAAQEIASADWPAIRHFAVPRRPSPLPTEDVEAQWQVCSPATVGSFTAAGYFFARELHRTLKVPVGLLHASWGGTRIEPWTPPFAFRAVPATRWLAHRVELADPRSDLHAERLGRYLGALEAWLPKARDALQQRSLLEPAPAWPAELTALQNHQDPSALYHGMIHPLVPYPIRGALWYQGESNHGEGRQYADKMRALIDGWRTIWRRPDLPFLYVMIAPWHYGEEWPEVLPEFWEVQASVEREVPNTACAVIHDIGDPNDIHPRNKQEVGRRLALLALRRVYGRADVVDRGPRFREFRRENGRLRVIFDEAAGGLRTRDGAAPSHFELCGADGRYHPASATIEGESVVLEAAAVPEPLGVRFGWHKLAMPNLVNAAGLPAAPFRAGHRRPDLSHAAVPDADQWSLVYDINLARLGVTFWYDDDRSSALTDRFDRVAYLLEIQPRANQPTNFVFVAMDAWTDNPRGIAIPAVWEGVRWQQAVSNLLVVSNVGGVPAGTFAAGWLEFWPANYGPHNSAGVPGASDEIFDFGDQPSEPAEGYGCMQVHLPERKLTLFAINHWSAGGGADIGMGNSSGATRDWTFSGNAGGLALKRLRVFVRR
ncbi:MAG: sialate O-acetylesterase [Kiritimatiellae bacterium]|nr:sialate O-acetylesterase [Kiritimatiellia bacterium]